MKCMVYTFENGSSLSMNIKSQLLFPVCKLMGQLWDLERIEQLDIMYLLIKLIKLYKYFLSQLRQGNLFYVSQYSSKWTLKRKKKLCL